MKRIIAADSPAQEAFDNAIDNLSDDLDYVLDGFEVLARRSKEDQSEALRLVLELSDQIKNMMSQVASHLE